MYNVSEYDRADESEIEMREREREILKNLRRIVKSISMSAKNLESTKLERKC